RQRTSGDGAAPAGAGHHLNRNPRIGAALATHGGQDKRNALMCDYSLHCVASRAAEAGEVLMVTKFYGTSTRGFASPSDPTVAVCLRPGTEVAFEAEACREGALFSKKMGDRVARFRQVELGNPMVH